MRFFRKFLKIRKYRFKQLPNTIIKDEDDLVWIDDEEKATDELNEEELNIQEYYEKDVNLEE